MGDTTKTKPEFQQTKAAPEIVIRAVGLCSSCNNQLTCFYRKKRGYDAQFCETFDDFTSSNGDQASAPIVATVVVTEEPVGDSDSQHKGLCINCEHRNACRLPRPASGVWHCEEYE